MINKITCLIKGHQYKEFKTPFLPRRVCVRCKKEQVKIPQQSFNPGWRDYKKSKQKDRSQ